MQGVVAIIIKMNNFSIAVFNMMNWTWTHTSQIDQIISNRCEIHHPDHHSVTIRCPPYANANTTRHRYCSPRICTILFLINVSFIYFSLLFTSGFFFGLFNFCFHFCRHSHQSPLLFLFAVPLQTPQAATILCHKSIQ